MFNHGDNLEHKGNPEVTDRIINVRSRMLGNLKFDEVYRLETDGGTYTKNALHLHWKRVV